MERLSQERKYLRIIVSHLALKEANQLLPQELPGKANCNFSTYQFYSANGKADSQADNQGYHQGKARSASQ